jgi:hypothetical protein
MAVGKWRFAQATVIGKAHLNQNTECQDRAACATIETDAGEILIAAVADGAGSSTRGQIGAEIACETFVAETKSVLQSSGASVKSINEDFGKLWLSYFQRRIMETAEVDKKNVRDYASTFIGAVVGENDAVFLQIGDGAAVYSTSGAADSYRFSIEMPESEYLNMTDFLTDEEADQRLHCRLIEERVEDLILFSDGIAAVAINHQNNQPYEPFLMPMIAPLRNGNSTNGLNQKLENFLSSPRINAKTDDDKTIILASRYVSSD